MMYSKTASYYRGKKRVMPTTPRKTKTITFSLPLDMAEQVQQVMKGEVRTMSELIREALRNYMEEREWLRTIRYERLREREDESKDAKCQGRSERPVEKVG